MTVYRTHYDILINIQICGPADITRGLLFNLSYVIYLKVADLIITLKIITFDGINLI